MGLFDYPSADPSGKSANAPPEFTLLADLPESSWRKILAIVEKLHFRKGDCIIRQGECDNSFFILSSGSVEVVIFDPHGREILVFEIPQGSVFGEIAFFDNSPRTATIRAREDGIAIRVTRKNFEHLAAWEPQIARRSVFELGSILAVRLRAATEQMSRHVI